MATMSMNKVIHGAFRRDLRRFVGALGGFETAGRQRAAPLGRAWDNFDGQLTEHHEGGHAWLPGPVLAILTKVFGHSDIRDVAPAWKG